MSIETWKAEFYPKPADKTKKSEAAAHSLKKWEGMTAVNLRRHGLHVTIYGDLYDGSCSFVVGSESCALCHHYFDASEEFPCEKCPLSIARGDAACDRERYSESVSPWSRWTHESDPRRMIFWLKKIA